MNALSIGIPSKYKSQTVNVLRDNTDYELFEIAPEKSFLCVCALIDLLFALLSITKLTTLGRRFEFELLNFLL